MPASLTKRLPGRLVRYARYARLRLQGFRLANPDFTDYSQCNERRTRLGLQEILTENSVPPLNVVLELGCGARTRTTPAIRHFANEVWGVDILPRDQVSGPERYMLVDPARADLLVEVPDNAIDAVIIINYIGFHPHSTWRSYFSAANDRLHPYLQPQNFPRVLRPGGFLVACEWEARPEARWRKAGVEHARSHALEEYQARFELPFFEFVGGGFSETLLSPYVVYRRGA
jgi:SAM-dependent methyltransferase